MARWSSSANPRGAELCAELAGHPPPGPCEWCERPAEWGFRPFRQRKAPPGQGIYVRACGRHWRLAADATDWLERQ